MATERRKSATTEKSSFDKETGTLNYSLRLTRNVGGSQGTDHLSTELSVGIPADPDNLDSAFEKARSFVQEKMKKDAAELKKELDAAKRKARRSN